MGTQPTFMTERGEVDEEIYGIWVDRGRGVVVRTFGRWSSYLGLALLDILSFQFWKAYSFWMAWTSYVDPSTYLVFS